ncbi:urate hydroxylase PuuD [Hydrogenophaga sp. 5NK40-0174]|uniref:urate hydroxylase PuuD n=1 Tax=Hydrogenophaga sp. 5NK40-0174 TaxID=3127649 RepID=UPI0033422171
MESYLLDWANLLLRWAHIIVAIAWIGSSFYFVFLDSSLTEPEDARLRAQGATGELWAVHGGGFYHPVKYAVAPPRLPGHLHWFYWESYSTWLTGFGLFAVSYLWRADIYLVDPQQLAMPGWQAGTLAVGLLLAFWVAYDMACRFMGSGAGSDRRLGLVVALLVAGFAWLATEWFAARAAFLLAGAMLATAMTANVLVWIIPGQRRVVQSLKQGEAPDPIHGQRGKQRSVHNTYFTLPVVFAMLSNHYSFLYSHEHKWEVLLALMAAGAGIRQFFVLRHGYKLGRHAHPWRWAAGACVLLVCLIAWLRPAGIAVDPPVASRAATDDAAVQSVLNARCVSCHGEALASKGIRLDSVTQARQHAALVYQQVVIQRAMPLNNATGMSEEERALLGAWALAAQR